MVGRGYLAPEYAGQVNEMANSKETPNACKRLDSQG